MKTASAVIVAVLAISAAFLWQQHKSFAMAAESARVQAQAPGVPGSALKLQVVSKEREGLEDLKRGEVQRFGDLTADDAVFVDAQGPATKAQVLQNVAGFRLTDYVMSDVRFVRIAPNTGLISYAVTEKGISHGKDFAAHVYVSSIWTERGNKWMCLFSQETAAR